MHRRSAVIGIPPSIGRDLGVFLLVTFSAAGAGALTLGSAGYLVQSMAVALAIALLVAWNRPDRVVGSGLGPANRVTLARAGVVVQVAGLPLQVSLTGTLAWTAIAAAALVLLLDGVDGAVARRTGSASAFGARFDMELDAFFILVLCALVWQTDKTGAWVLLIGGLRYLFVAAGWLWPTLRRELPDSLRRKAVCVIQGMVLPVCLAPLVPPSVAAPLALVALALLVYSFATDTRWLLANAHTDANV